MKQWKKEFAKRLSEKLGADVTPSEITVPPDASQGELAYPCFRIAKERKVSPADLAKEIVDGLGEGWTAVASVQTAGGFVNVTLKTGEAVHQVILDVETGAETYGDAASEEGRIAVEFAQPNTHKEIHVGHVRNFVLGSTLIRLLQASGHEVISMSYHGDVGAHVAKCLWQLVKQGGVDPLTLTREDVRTVLGAVTPEQQNGRWLGEVYAKSTESMEADPDAQAAVSFVQRKLEERDPVWDVLWQETRRWSLDEMSEVFRELGLVIDRQYLESEVVDRGQEIVDALMEKKIAKESQGALVVDLEDVKLGIFLIRKSDGASLYATKDLALAELKAKEYPDVQRSLVVVDNRQTLYFKQLFETLRRMGLDVTQEFVGYEFVTLKSGAMSSREGNVVSYATFRDAVLETARREVLTRHEDWSEGKVLHTAWCIMLAGVKFGMLRQDSDRVFTFDVEQALSFDGATGPYIQYAATRLASILRKAKEAGDVGFEEGDARLTLDFSHPSEKALALSVAALPDVLAKAAHELRPALVAQWALETAQRVNDFYRDVSVMESTGELRDGRLRLVKAARMALARGLSILGIPIPDEM